MKVGLLVNILFCARQWLVVVKLCSEVTAFRDILLLHKEHRSSMSFTFNIFFLDIPCSPPYITFSTYLVVLQGLLLHVMKHFFFVFLLIFLCRYLPIRAYLIDSAYPLFHPLTFPTFEDVQTWPCCVHCPECAAARKVCRWGRSTCRTW